MKGTERTLLVCAALLLFAPSAATAANEDTASVAKIRKYCGEIDASLTKLRKVVRDLAGQSAEGGQLEAFYSGKDPVKLTATCFGETGKLVEEYYFREGLLVFACTVRHVYTAPLSGRTARREENRCYFERGRMIRWTGPDGKEIPSSDGSFRKQEGRVLGNAAELLDKLR